MSWRDRYFEEGYLRRWHLAPPGEAHFEEAAAFLALGDKGGGARVLDLGCGHGRYSLGLAKAGAHVVGLDASRALLERARSQASTQPYPVSWVRGDMRSLPFGRTFDVVLIVSAFGYFDTDGEDLAFLKGVMDVLEDDGRLVMRNANATRIRNDFRSVRHEERKGRRISIHSSLDAEGRWLGERLIFEGDPDEAEFERRQIIYSASELSAILAEAGFAPVAHYSGVFGESFEERTSTSIITVGEKPRSPVPDA